MALRYSFFKLDIRFDELSVFSSQFVFLFSAFHSFRHILFWMKFYFILYSCFHDSWGGMSK